LGIEAFSLSQTSLEQVFMHFVKEQEVEDIMEEENEDKTNIQAKIRLYSNSSTK